MNNATDNYENGFPARMSDGRQFTDYRQNCITNNEISQGMSSWEYRNFLTNNAGDIHKASIEKARAINECKSCSDNTVLPVKNTINCGPTGCVYEMNDANGIGLGVNYSLQ
jgi:hypothetical protein|tara:strand:+ start:107 stop:439 length:333 start_codon:yes stop_codon:yes gene_type:complete